MTETVALTAHFTIAEPRAEYPMHGVFGGVTPQGEIAASFFSERSAIPKELDMFLSRNDDGTPTGVPQETDRRGKVGVIRTVTSTYYLNADMAESVGRWFLDKAAERRALDGDR